MAVMTRNTLLILAPFVATVGLLACQPAQLGLAQEVRSECDEANVDAKYFSGIFIDRVSPQDATIEGFSRLLQRLGEPSLSCGNKSDGAYRLVFVGQNKSAVISAARTAKGGRIRSIVIDAVGKKEQEEPDGSLSESEWNALNNAVAQYNFWSRSPYPSPTTQNHGLIVPHGNAWILEGRDGRWYHAVSRTSMARERDFDAVAHALFRAANIDVPAEFRVLHR